MKYYYVVYIQDPFKNVKHVGVCDYHPLELMFKTKGTLFKTTPIFYSEISKEMYDKYLENFGK